MFNSRSVRRILTGILSLATALTLVAVSASSAEAAPPTAAAPIVHGYIDAVVPVAGHIKLAGWSFDPKRPGVSNTEDVVLDGVMAALPWANLARPDVNRAFKIAGRHGYNVAIPAKAGVHRVCVIARAVAGSGATPRVLGCKTVRVPAS